MGAAHGMEIPFALGPVGTDRAREFTGVTGPCEMSEAVHRRWVEFVMADRRGPGPRVRKGCRSSSRQMRAPI